MTAEPATFLIDTPTGQRHVDLSAFLDPAAVDQAATEANAWVKSLRHLEVDGRRLRDRFTHRGDSLWWFIELYLSKRGTIRLAIEIILGLERLLEREQPHAMTVLTGGPLVRGIAPQLTAARGVAYRGAPGFDSAHPGEPNRLTAGLFHLAQTLLARLHWPATPSTVGVDVASFVHSAFWKAGSERRSGDSTDTYIGPVLGELESRMPAGRMCVVGIGPRTSYHARGHSRRSRAAALPSPIGQIERFAGIRAVLPSLHVWWQRFAIEQALTSSADLRRAARIHGCDLWPVVKNELVSLAAAHLPWSARAMDEAGAALDTIRPRVVVTYAEAGGWGRALVLEARRRGIPSVGLQHGFIFRHWLNYLHEPDEIEPSPDNPADRGFPVPDLTLVFDGLAASHLVTSGHFPPTAVRITGSPRLDRLVSAVSRLTPDDRAAIRAGAGAGPAQHLVLVATKFTQVQPVLDALLAAFATLSDVHAVIKCHPGEGPEPYEAAAGHVGNVSVLPGDSDLAGLLAEARVVVTVNSTVAIEGCALGVPALTLALPNNLSPFVSAGAMAGLTADEPIAPTLERLLYDDTWRAALLTESRALGGHHAIGADGLATQRAADAIMALAQPNTAPPPRS